MNGALIKKSNNPPSVIQKGEKNVNITNAEGGTLNVNYTTVYAKNDEPIVMNNKKNFEPLEINTEYYNLFVCNDVDISKNESFIIHHEKVLTGAYTEDSIKTKFATLSDSQIKQIKTFPCIFSNENKSNGYTNVEDYAGYGFVKQIDVTNNGVKIHPNITHKLPQQILNENSSKLNIWNSSFTNELDEAHWSIKKSNLKLGLSNLGLDLKKG